jgi:mono/diheme cytochrome c family protein
MSVSLLTYLPPAKIVVPSYELSGNATADDLRVHINVAPGTVGQNTFTVSLSSNGQPVKAVKEALLRFTPAKSGVPPSEAQLLARGDGSYSVKGSYLSLPSEWQLQVVIRRQAKFDSFANFSFAVLAPGQQRQSAGTQNMAGAVILLDGLLFGLAMWGFSGRRLLPLGASGVLSLVLVVGGLYFVRRPASAGSEQANPIVPDAKSVAAGQALYDSHCVPCHGTGGKGDGPLGLTLIPRPADLTIHAVPGVHSDAQLFEWITDGFPGSAMPAWKSSLSDTDRWNLVNFIRTLAPKN